MSRISGLTLGIVTALGGFVDIGELVFASQAGARFGYALLWPVVLGVLAIIVYSEMCGRVAIVGRRPVFELVRERLGFSLGLCALIGATIMNVLTCAAEVGGVAIILRLIVGLPYGLTVAGGLVALIVVVSVLPFDKLERVFGLMGLFMLVFVVAAVILGVDWGAAVGGLVPNVPASAGAAPATYAYFVVGLVAATIMPYEVQFYSSGTIEEEKTPDDLRENGVVAGFGYAFGSVVTIAIIVCAAEVLQPRGIQPADIGASFLGPIRALAVVGLLGALLGALFAVGGAAIETSLAGAYGIAQFFRFEWGKERSPWHVPRFTVTWLAIFGLAALILVTGVDPVDVTEYAVVFSVVVLPLTYLPILLVARDRTVMGEHVNNRVANVAGLLCFALVVVVAVAAVPVLYLSRLGQA